MTRDILPPLTGVFLSIYLPLAGEFSAWQLPLIAGLFGIPLVAPRPAPEDSASSPLMAASEEA